MNHQRFWLKIGTIYVLLIFWVGCIIIIGVKHPLFPVGMVVPWLIGFFTFKSTKVPVNPTEIPFSQIIRLTYKEYDRWAEQIVRSAKNMRFYASPYVHYTQKFSLLFTAGQASKHVFAPRWCIVVLIPMNILLGFLAFSTQFEVSISKLTQEQLIGFGVVSAIMIGFPGGFVVGLFYRWLRAKW